MVTPAPSSTSTAHSLMQTQSAVGEKDESGLDLCTTPLALQEGFSQSSLLQQVERMLQKALLIWSDQITEWLSLEIYELM